MENIKWHYALRLLLQWLSPTGTERAWPISAFRPKGETGDSSPLWPAVAHQLILTAAGDEVQRGAV
jgi:hypothetical protein